MIIASQTVRRFLHYANNTFLVPSSLFPTVQCAGEKLDYCGLIDCWGLKVVVSVVMSADWYRRACPRTLNYLPPLQEGSPNVSSFTGQSWLGSRNMLLQILSGFRTQHGRPRLGQDKNIFNQNCTALEVVAQLDIIWIPLRLRLFCRDNLYSVRSAAYCTRYNRATCARRPEIISPWFSAL